MVSTCERLINVVKWNKPKMLSGLSQKGTVAGRRSHFASLVDMQRHRRRERTSPTRLLARNTVSPQSSRYGVGSRKAYQRDWG